MPGLSYRRTMLPGAFLLLLAACGGNDGGPSIDPDVATDVTVTPGAPALADCATLPLTLVALNGLGDTIDSPTITWTALDPSIATVNGAGVVSGQGAGVARVEGKVGEVSDTATITVSAVPLTLTIAVDTAVVYLGSTYSIPAVVTNCHGTVLPATPVTFVPVDSTVATVSANGLVTPVKLGWAGVIASIAGGSTDSITIPVGRSYTFAADTTLDSDGRTYGVAINRVTGVAFANRPDANAVMTFGLLTRGTNLTAMTVGSIPTGLSIDPAGNKVWVASQVGMRIDFANAATAAGGAFTEVPNNPYWTTTNGSGSRAYVSGNGSMVRILDGTTGALIDSANVDADPFGLAITPGGATLFVGHLTSATIRAVNTTTMGSVVFKTLGGNANGMAVSPNGAILVVASQAMDSVYFLNAINGATLGQTAVPSPWGVAFTGDGSEVWVTSLGGSVYQLNAATRAVTNSVVLGGTPRGIAIHPYGWGAAVGNEDGHLHIMK